MFISSFLLSCIGTVDSRRVLELGVQGIPLTLTHTHFLASKYLVRPQGSSSGTGTRFTQITAKLSEI